MIKRKFKIFTIADYEEEEKWLREQHNKGWKYVKMTGCLYTFEKCTPEDVIYRLDYKNGSENDEYFRMFRDYGWQYLDTKFGWTYFRKSAREIQEENDGEIFSDSESKLDIITHLIKTRMMPILTIFLCIVIPNFMKAINDKFTGLNIFFIAFFSLMIILYVYIIIYCGIKLKKLRDKYKKTN